MTKRFLPLLGLLVGACATKPKPQWLMPTPQLFADGKVDPFVHLPESSKSPRLEVFYATNRVADGDGYGNGMDDRMHFGNAVVSMGPPGETWASLAAASTTHPREEPIEMRLEDSRKAASAKPWAGEVDRRLRKTETKDVILYVHGARVGFLHACAFAAELDHFAGRDFTPVAFDWPTHQEIYSYIDRADLGHAKRSGEKLAEVVRLLADETSVRRIHIVSWSAGARVLSRAMVALGGDAPEKVRGRYRLGTLVFAAGDVPERDFLERLPAVHGLSDRTLVYLSDNDSALRWAARLMGGGRRLGLAPVQPDEAEMKALREMKRLEVVDTSYGKGERGFDISGHRYWFQHPWVNSDLLLALRTGASPEERGLKPAPLTGVWYFGSEYPKRIGGIGRRLTSGQW